MSVAAPVPAEALRSDVSDEVTMVLRDLADRHP